MLCYSVVFQDSWFFSNLPKVCSFIFFGACDFVTKSTLGQFELLEKPCYQAESLELLQGFLEGDSSALGKVPPSNSKIFLVD
jgi:hypothetical protein